MQDHTKAQTYSNHLDALGYRVWMDPEGSHLLEEKDSFPSPLSLRYHKAAHHLRWHDRGVSHGVQGRMKYLALLLDILARQLQHHPLHFTMQWIDTQLDYEKTHNAHAVRMLSNVRAHLTREQK